MAARWYSIDPRTSEEVDYSTAEAKKLEDSYQGRKNAITLTVHGMKFTIDVKGMTQSNNSGGSRQVKRVPRAGAGAGAPAASTSKSVAVPKSVTDCWNSLFRGEDSITADQFGPLFDALKVDASNADCFVFVYILKCKGCWKITKEEFEQGLTANGISPTAKDVGKAISAKKSLFLKDTNEWKLFNAFVFAFCRNSATATIVPTEEATPVMRIAFSVAPKRMFPEETLLAFVEKNARAVTGDIWKQVGKFCLETKKDLSNFDEGQCWNSLIDDFIESQQK